MINQQKKPAEEAISLLGQTGTTASPGADLRLKKAQVYALLAIAESLDNIGSEISSLGSEAFPIYVCDGR